MSKRVILWSTPEQVAKEAAEVKAGNGLLLLGDIDGSLVEVIIPATHSMDDVKARGEAAEAARAPTAGARVTPDIVTFTYSEEDGAWAHVTAPDGKQYGVSLAHLAEKFGDSIEARWARAIADRVREG